MVDDEISSAVAELRLNGVRYGYWQRVEARTSVDDLCASVQLGFAGTGVGQRLGMNVNTVAQVLLDGDLVTTVRPDVVRRRVGKDSHSISVTARSLARELVDCQYSKTLSGLKLAEIVKRLCDTFKVPVKIMADTPVVPNFSMQCEVPANALINAVRASNLLLYPLPDGGLILTEPADTKPVATLEYGVNIGQYDIVDEYKLRFSDYVVKSFDYSGNQPLKGGIKDDSFTFFRPMHIVADRMSASLGSCEQRAILERNRRKARAHRIELEVPRWKYLDNDGSLKLWRINTQVRVIIPEEEIDDVFLIGDITQGFDDKGADVTHLQVMPRDAFLGEPKKKIKRGVGTKGARK